MDNGLYQTLRNKPDTGQLWENACFLELRRNGRKPDFWLAEKGEIDFVTGTELIQVCHSLHEGNKERETNSLLRGIERIPGKQPVIWTREPSGEELPENLITSRSGLLSGE